MKYFSTFISGLSPIIETWLRKNVRDIKIVKILDGLVIYEGIADISEAVKFPVFNNTFIFLKEFKGENYNFSDLIIDKSLLKSYKTFRIRILEENELVSIDKTILSRLEDQITQKTGLEVDRTNPNTEVWVLKRKNEPGLVGLRITKKGNLEKVLKKGELRPELAYLLNYISDPNSKDIFLDPFAGYGAIPKARLKYFPAKEIIASDFGKNLLDELRNIKGIRVENWNATNLGEVKDDTIHKIVTDPPLGIYLEQENIADFYSKMLKEFDRVLKTGGIAVILTAQKDSMDKLLLKSTSFTLKEKFDILVSGKKSAIYKIQRI